MAGLFMPPADTMTVKQESTNQIPPEQARLLNLQGTQFSALTPLLTALGLGKAGALGVKMPNRFTPALDTLSARGITPDQALKITQDYGKGIYSGTPQDRDILLALDAYGTAPDQLSNVLVRGAPSSAGTNQAATRLADELHQAMTQTGQQQDIYSDVSLSPLVKALQASLRLSPSEEALPEQIGQTANPLASRLAARTGQFQDNADLIRRLAMEQGPALQTRMTGLTKEGLDMTRAPLDSDAMLFDINQQMERNILPEVRAAAIRAGQAPDVNSSGYSRLLGDVSRQYGGKVAQTFAENELNRRNAFLNALNIGQRGELGAGMLDVQGLTLGQAASADALNAERTAIPTLMQLLLAGPEATAQLAATKRTLAGQEAAVPYNLLTGADLTPGAMPQYPTSSSMTESREPSVGTQVGSGLTQALMLGLLGPSAYANMAGLFSTPALTSYAGIGGAGAASAALFGGAGATGATTGLAGALAMGCWIAELLYGKHSPKVRLLRHWLFTVHPDWWVSKLYLAYGERFAAWLKQHPRWQPVVRMVFDGWVRRANLELLRHAV